MIEKQPFEATTFDKPVEVEVTQEDRAYALAVNHVGGTKNYTFKINGKNMRVKVCEAIN